MEVLAHENTKNPYLEQYHLKEVPVYPGNRIMPLINGPAYFAALVKDMNRLGRNPDPAENGKEYIYITSFVLNWVQEGFPFTVDGSDGPIRFIDLILEKARAGVDVRVLAWIPWNLSLAGKIDIRPESGDNMRTIQALRQEPAMAQKACLNIIAHPAGSSHLKLTILGGPHWSAGYTGGIDLSPDRGESNWLDIQARVEGPAAQPLYDLYRDVWNQNLIFSGQAHDGAGQNTRLRKILRAPRPVVFTGRGGTVSSVVPGTPLIVKRSLPIGIEKGTDWIQSLLTMPAFRFAPSPLLGAYRVEPLEFWNDGIFQIRDAMQTAILAAEDYIYIEDQYFWSVEVMRWINQTLRQKPDLRVVLVTGESDQLGDRLEAYRTIAVTEGLLPELNQQQRERVTFIQRKDMIHAKTILVDDRWAMIGSANIARRSLYMDIENALAFSSPNTGHIQDYRIALWSSRLGLRPDMHNAIKNINIGLQMWNENPERIGEILPFKQIYHTPPIRPVIDQEWYEMVEDPDSRHPWYFPIRRSYKQFFQD